MTDQNKLRRLAVLNVLHARIGREIAAAKASLGEIIGRGSMTAFATPGDPNSEVIGVLSMSKPRQPKPRIVDEQAAMLWLLDEFGDQPGLVEARLTEQGKKSALAAHAAGREVPGIETPPPGNPVVSFRQTPEGEAAIEAMYQRGELHIADVIAIEAPEETK
ncbi:hypothetical protein SEA_FINKLE_58 [Gordonia phage Finkle]|uniref:Uncharacterized protein n=1 Tax=Gordonia phage Finkle TaxID=2926099 RepID=A0A9E7NJ19_9CAUD|nr:hypothetical protein QEH33_gp58 [Gordonia phage Finkle]UTN92972.1 hypothetical protein SEA_FINKLE_58 [Gordonia phage Finkle]